MSTGYVEIATHRPVVFVLTMTGDYVESVPAVYGTPEKAASMFVAWAGPKGAESERERMVARDLMAGSPVMAMVDGRAAWVFVHPVVVR